MKKIYQNLLVLISFLIIYYLLNYINSQISFNLPISIISLIIFFVLLLVKIIDYNSIKTVCNSLLSHISLLFIPAIVLILEQVEILKSSFIQIIIIIVISSALVYLGTYYTAYFLMKGVKNK